MTSGSPFREQREQELLGYFRRMTDRQQDILLRRAAAMVGRPAPKPAGLSPLQERMWRLATGLSPSQFRDFVALLFVEQGYEFHLALRSAGTRRDLVLEKGRSRVLVQCRHRTADLVGEGAVRDLLGLMNRTGIRRGFLVTNLDFTAGARAFADDINQSQRGQPITLVDAGQIQRWLRDPQFARAREFLDSPDASIWQEILKQSGKRRRRRDL
jgi:hypothetical protein